MASDGPRPGTDRSGTDGSGPDHPAEHRALAVLLVLGGLGHFLAPRVYDSIVPGAMPGGRRFWTLLSGVAEVLTGLAVANLGTRRAGGLAAAALFVGVFPANVQMAWQWRHRSWPYRLLALARLPLQVPLVAWGLRVASAARVAPVGPVAAQTPSAAPGV